MIRSPLYLVIHHTGIDQEEQQTLINKDHQGRGYSLGSYGNYVCYHFTVGKDGTVIQNRSLTERAYCTRNEEVNNAAIQVVVTGDFTKEQPTESQERSLRILIHQLDSLYHFKRIMGHNSVSPTACPGKNLLTAIHDILRNALVSTPYMISRYYTPIPGQLRYYRKTYEQDFKINCQGDCFKTADGYTLTAQDAMKVAACPPDMPFGQKLGIEGIGTVTCHDHGGAIKGKHIDVWAGISTDGLRNMATTPSGFLSVVLK